MSHNETYRRRALRRDEIIEIIARQGGDLGNLCLPKGAREKAIWNLIEEAGCTIPCGNPKCHNVIAAKKQCIRDHKISLRSVCLEKRAEHDQAWNQWYLCLECNGLKTYKRGLAGLGSDASRIAKLRRIERGKKPCRQATIPSRPFPRPLKKPDWPKARLASGSLTARSKIPSRPFPKRRKDKDECSSP